MVFDPSLGSNTLWIVLGWQRLTFSLVTMSKNITMRMMMIIIISIATIIITIIHVYVYYIAIIIIIDDDDGFRSAGGGQ